MTRRLTPHEKKLKRKVEWGRFPRKAIKLLANEAVFISVLGLTGTQPWTGLFWWWLVLVSVAIWIWCGGDSHWWGLPDDVVFNYLPTLGTAIGLFMIHLVLVLLYSAFPITWEMLNRA